MDPVGPQRPHDSPQSPMRHLSVVIPTRDRPHLLVHALRALAAQTFRDFEVVVSDNSTTDSAASGNREAIAEAAGALHLRYIRPSEPMNMPDHWEWATRQADGQHVIVHTDRFLLRPSALQLIAHCTSSGPAGELVGWNNHSSLGPGLVPAEWPCSTRIFDLDSAEVLRRYARMDSWRTTESWMIWLPRCISACYHADLASRVRARCGRLFFPSNPDFTSAYLLLAHADRYCFIDRNLAVGHGTESNGRKALLYGARHATHVEYRPEWLDRSPVQMETITNALIVDLLNMKRVAPERMAGVEVDLAGAYLSNFRELVSMERHGSFQDTRRMWNALLDFARALPPEVRDRVLEGAAGLAQIRPQARWWRRVMARCAFNGMARAAYGMVSRLRRTASGQPVYPSIQAALQGTDCQVGSIPYPSPERAPVREIS